MSDESSIEEKKRLEILGICDNDVISNQDRSHRVSKLKDVLYAKMEAHISHLENLLRQANVLIDAHKWFGGDECEVLKVGAKGWQKGIVKLTLVLEFVPDLDENLESETLEDLGFSGARSPLDDIRQMDI